MASSSSFFSGDEFLENMQRFITTLKLKFQSASTFSEAFRINKAIEEEEEIYNFLITEIQK